MTFSRQLGGIFILNPELRISGNMQDLFLDRIASRSTLNRSKLLGDHTGPVTPSGMETKATQLAPTCPFDRHS